MSLFRRFFGKSTTKLDTPDKSSPNTASSQLAENQEVSENSGALPSNAHSVEPINIADGVTRPLPPETIISTQNEHIIFGQSTDVGSVRSNNQDAALSLFFANRSAEERPDFGLFVVADGMGGHHDGEKASAITTRTLTSHITKSIYLPLLTENKNDQSAITEAMIKAVQEANNNVIAEVPDGGTTLSAVVLVGNSAYIAHVGDSRVYAITNNEIEQITRDHSLVQRLIELDQIKPEEAENHPQKNVLYRALGQSEDLEVETHIWRLQPNSYLLICSDGLWGQVDKQKILETVMNNPNPQEVCDKLVAMANTNGGIDNITTILLKTPSN